MRQLRKKADSESCSGVDLFCFNIQPEELGDAYELLDKQAHRRAMMVSYSDDYNFIIKYMGSAAHQSATRFFDLLINFTARQLTGAAIGDTGFSPLGSATYHLSGGRKEPDCSYMPWPFEIDSPTIVLEVGTSEIFAHLRNNAKGWLEHGQVQMVILLSIDPPTVTLNTPQIQVEHWKLHQSNGANHITKVASKVWSADWTLAVSPNYYILLADLFGATPIPAIYGANERLTFNVADVASWRQNIIDRYKKGPQVNIK